MPLTRFCLMILIASLSGLVTSCGWQLSGGQLRGSEHSAASYYVADIYGSVSPAFDLSIRQRLISSAEGTSDPATSATPLILTIEDYRFEKRTLTVTTSGQVSDIELLATLLVRINASESDSPSAIDELVTVKSRRLITTDPNRVLASRQELALRQQELEQQLIQQLHQRLRFMSPTFNRVSTSTHTSSFDTQQVPAA